MRFTTPTLSITTSLLLFATRLVTVRGGFIASAVTPEGNSKTVVYDLLYSGLKAFCWVFPNEECETFTNDGCDMAIPIVDGQFGKEIGGTTFGQGIDSVDACADAGAPVSPGVWYKFEGTGKPFKVSTCGTKSEFDTIISVFYLPSSERTCGESALQCVAGTDDNGGNSGSCSPNEEVRFITAEGVTYYVLVHGFVENETGAFNIKFQEINRLPNNRCGKAEELTIDGSAVFSNTDIARYDDFPECGSAKFDYSPTVWYSVNGNGRELVATTCTDGMDDENVFDTQISVFTGACGRDTLNCVDGNDDSCGGKLSKQSTVSWVSEADTTYLIAVHGFGSVGAFGLRVFNTAQNNRIADAKLLVPGKSILGSTSKATAVNQQSFPACGKAERPNTEGVWYKFIGDGERYHLSTCETNGIADAIFDTQISVYSESFGSDVTCVGGIDDTCGNHATITIDTEINKEYDVLVHGFPNENKPKSRGDFMVMLAKEKETPSNNECSNAIDVPVGTDLILGHTTNGFVQTGVPPCGDAAKPTGPGVWYTFKGNGNDVVISTCDTENEFFDTQISIFKGSCGAFFCVDGNDDGCNLLKSSVAITKTNDGETYYVLVHGFATSSGDFVLTIKDTDATPPMNNDPSLATPITGGLKITGTTKFARIIKNHLLPACGDAFRQTAPGVWYSVEGTGGSMTASTLGSNYDTMITVVKAMTKECVAGNDDGFGDIPVDGKEVKERSSRVTWDSETNQQYWILVHGYASSSRGEYSLNIE